MLKLDLAFQRRRLFCAALPLELAAVMFEFICNVSRIDTAEVHVLVRAQGISKEFTKLVLSYHQNFSLRAFVEFFPLHMHSAKAG